MFFNRSSLSRNVPLLAAVALLGMSAHPARAQTVTSSTNVTFITAPTDVTEGQHTSNTNVTGFMENQNLVLTSSLGLNIASPGTYTSSISAGSIPTGSHVNSYYIYSDPVGAGAIFTGSITFNSDILGLEVTGNALNNTDTLLGLAGTSYPSSDNARGLELTGVANSDSITLSSDRRTVSWILTTGTSVDGFRVLTTVPEPTMALPLGLMLLSGLALWRRRPVSFNQPV